MLEANRRANFATPVVSKHGMAHMVASIAHQILIRHRRGKCPVPLVISRVLRDNSTLDAGFRAQADAVPVEQGSLSSHEVRTAARRVRPALLQPVREAENARRAALRSTRI